MLVCKLYSPCSKDVNIYRLGLKIVIIYVIDKSVPVIGDK